MSQASPIVHIVSDARNLGQLLLNPDRKYVAYQFSGPQTWDQFAEELVIEVRRHGADFFIAPALKTSELIADPYLLGQQIGNIKKLTLVLLEADQLNLDATAFKVFIEGLVEGGKAGLVFHTRAVNLAFWRPFIQNGAAQIIGNQPDDITLPVLSVKLFGTLTVTLDGELVGHWDGRLPRDLFVYFITHVMATRDEAFDLFWPTMQVREATNVYHVSKRKISETLGAEVTRYNGGFYTRSPKLNYVVDLDQFYAAIAREDWVEAINIVRGQRLFAGIDRLMPWMTALADEVTTTYVNALVNQAAEEAKAQNYDAALNYYLRAVSSAPIREDAVRGAMHVYLALGQKRQAVKVYKALEKRLVRREWRPSPETVRLYTEIAGI